MEENLFSEKEAPGQNKKRKVMPLQPLPQAVITAAKLRRMAADLILQAEELEASTGMGKYQPTRVVEFEFSKKRQAEEKPEKRNRKQSTGGSSDGT